MRDTLNSESDPQPKHSWIRGAVISGIGVLVGAVSFAVFCHALGLNFQDEGWANNRPRDWQSNRIALIGSLVGFSSAILAFWLGFIQITRR